MPVPLTTRWVAFAAAVVLAATPVATASATSRPAPTAENAARPDAAGGVPSPRAAQKALAAVQAAFDGKVDHRGALARSTTTPARGEHRDLTMAMLDLQLARPALTGDDRRLADSLLARPTDGLLDPDANGYLVPEATPVCSSLICVHYVTSSSDAPPLTDTNVNTIPDQVETTLAAMENVWSRIVTQGGYRAPLSDGGRGGDARFDVYLVDVGDDGYYGYCNIDEPAPFGSGFDAPGYCVLDDDYSPTQFGTANTPLENLQVTAAHEFFHAVQFAYDYAEDRWFMEGTAAWIEDELFDAVNDNVFYLRKSQMTKPSVPLDYYDNDWHPYGSWVWWRFLSERFPDKAGTGLPVIIRDIWRRADDANPASAGTYSLDATARTLAARNQNFAGTYARFGVANRQPKRSYSEGALYPVAPLAKTYRLSKAKRTFPLQVASMAHLTNLTVAVKPGDGLRAKGWKLRINVDGPNKARGSFAMVTVVKKSGARATAVIALNKKGVGKRTVTFRTGTVARVELTLTNAGRRYDCWQGTQLACQGRSLDNGLKTYFKATVVR